MLVRGSLLLQRHVFISEAVVHQIASVVEEPAQASCFLAA